MRVRVIAAFVAIIALAGCSKSAGSTPPSPSSVPPTPATSPTPSEAPTTPAASTGDLSGSWTGQWERVGIAGQGTMDLTLQQQGSTLTGSIEFHDSLCLTPARRLTGTVAGNAVRLSVDDGGTQATFTGTLTGSTLAGDATVTCHGLTGGATWTVSRS